VVVVEVTVVVIVGLFDLGAVIDLCMSPGVAMKPCRFVVGEAAIPCCLEGSRAGIPGCDGGVTVVVVDVVVVVD